MRAACDRHPPGCGGRGWNGFSGLPSSRGGCGSATCLLRRGSFLCGPCSELVWSGIATRFGCDEAVKRWHPAKVVRVQFFKFLSGQVEKKGSKCQKLNESL